jgi:hypothetical protein
MNLERPWKEAIVDQFKVAYNPNICLQGLRKATSRKTSVRTAGDNPPPPQAKAEC